MIFEVETNRLIDFFGWVDDFMYICRRKKDSKIQDSRFQIYPPLEGAGGGSRFKIQDSIIPLGMKYG